MAYPVVIRELPSQNEVDLRFVVNTSAAVNNGVLVTPTDALVTGYRDVYGLTTLASANLWIATGVEALYETGKHLDDYTNAAGAPFRIERLVKGAIFAISSDGISVTTPATNQVVGANAIMGSNGVITLKATAASGDVIVGKVIDIFSKGGKTFISIMFNGAPTTAS